MANGTMISEGDYFNDDKKRAYSAGTLENMWVVEDCYDFIAMLHNKNAYHRLVNDIDFNKHDTYKRGFVGSLSFSSYNSLYGDNHTIKNMVVVSQKYQPIRFQKIVDCNFANIVAIDCAWNPIGAINAERCDFGMKLINSWFDFCYGLNDYLTANDCTFNVKGILTGFKFDKIIAKQCHFNLDVTINKNYLFTAGAPSNADRFVGCYVTGRIKNLYDGTVTWKTDNFNPTNSYFAFEYEQPSTEAIDATTAYGANNFIDGELFSKNGVTITSNTDSFKILTTEQSKSVEYLDSIGFITHSEVT